MPALGNRFKKYQSSRQALLSRGWRMEEILVDILEKKFDDERPALAFTRLQVEPGRKARK